MLYTTSEKQEGFIAFHRSGEKAGLRAGLCFVKPTLGAMRLRDRIRFAKVMAKGGEGFNRKTDRKRAVSFRRVGLRPRAEEIRRGGTKKTIDDGGEMR